MCLSVPMRVESWLGDGEIAWVVRGERREQANMLLVGPQPVGTWVLVALGFAKDVLDDEALALTEEALAALAATLDGDYDPDAWFGDLSSGNGMDAGRQSAAPSDECPTSIACDRRITPSAHPPYGAATDRAVHSSHGPVGRKSAAPSAARVSDAAAAETP